MVACAESWLPEAVDASWHDDSGHASTWYDRDTDATAMIVARRVGTVEQGEAIFTGYITDNETGLLHAWSRMYSCGTGRFISRDPVGPNHLGYYVLEFYDLFLPIYHGGQLYAYAGNRPYVLDPSGMDGISEEEMAEKQRQFELDQQGDDWTQKLGGGSGGGGGGGARGGTFSWRIGGKKGDGSPPAGTSANVQPKPAKPTSPNQLQKEVEKGGAPSSVDRADKPHPGQGSEQPHVHFKDGRVLNYDGTWSHVGRMGGSIWRLTNCEREWLLKHGVQVPTVE